MDKVITHQFSLIIIVLFLFVGCQGGRKLNEILKKSTPYEKYKRALKDANLDNTAIGRAWIAVGQKALNDSLIIKIPFSETGFFSETEPDAVGYKIVSKEGEKIAISVDIKGEDRSKVFLDVFEVHSGNQTLKQVASADTANLRIEYEVKKSGIYIIRIQPELLQNVQYTITVQSKPSIGFPVSGKGNLSIGSFFGDVRDAGRRKHEGIDIFATRNTPVLAVSDGFISSVTENRLGGNVIFLRDTKRGVTYYYAHLDSQYVRPGQKVAKGDTVGVVGNTGNAKYTQPHLHFGIYSSGKGAVDPLPFVWVTDTIPPKIVADEKKVGTWGRINVVSGNFRGAPDGVIFGQLTRNTPFIIKGVSDNWYRVKLPDSVGGYVHSNIIEPANTPIKIITNEKSIALLTAPNYDAVPIDSILAESNTYVLGEIELFHFVKTSSGKTGWLKKQ